MQVAPYNVDVEGRSGILKASKTSKAFTVAGEPGLLPNGRRMRVAIVASSYNYIRDGVALTLNRLVEHLEKAGVEVRVFTPVNKKRQAFQHRGQVVPVPSIPLPGRSDYRLAFGLPRAEIEAFKPDIIHVALAPDWLGYSTLRMARRLGVPLVASYHTCYEKYLEYYGVANLFTRLLKNYLSSYYATCKEVYVPTQSMIDELRKDGLHDNFILWQRGVDADLFNPAQRSQAWRQSLGIGPDEVVVLFVSRLVREKQLATLAGVFTRLKAQGVPFRSLVVGDGPERQMLEQACPDTIFTGTLQGEELARAYASGDIFVFPSDTETFGNVTLEAMAAGLPCVCASAPGSQSLVVDGETGFLATPRDADSFTIYVKRLLEDPELRHRMGLAARERSLSFSWSVPMEMLLNRYRKLVNGTTA